MQLFTACYSEKTYKYADELQKMKVETSIAKKQLIFFMERCIKSSILPRSFRLKPSNAVRDFITFLSFIELWYENNTFFAFIKLSFLKVILSSYI